MLAPRGAAAVAVAVAKRAQSTAAAAGPAPPSWVGIRVNGRKLLVSPKMSVLQACEEAQVSHPSAR